VSGVIDYLINPFWPEAIKKNYLEGGEGERLASVGRVPKAYEPDEFIAQMDKDGLQHVLIASIFTWNYIDQHAHVHTTWEEVAAYTDRYPERMSGLYGVNPFRGMRGVREFETAVKEHGFRGIHIHPHGFGLRPDDAFYFPFYAKALELGVPVVISMGHTLDFMPQENARPILLDRIAIYFPDLKLVCAHTGWPWVEEAIAIASKHPNVYLGTSAYAPKYWKPEMVQFLNSRRGNEKTMFGTDWPLFNHSEALAQLEDLGLKPENKQKLLHDNAARVFGLD
jgi:predicted TIM-barrel fold metal-dependent hydrolase